MSKNVQDNLKLIGKNQEDLRVISAYFQDSVAVVRDIIFLKQNRIFIIIANRFMWEDIEKGLYRENKRIRSAIKFEEILQVKSQRINQKNENQHLECLAIKCSEILNKNYEIDIFFSGGGVITLISESIDVVMHDLGTPWNVKYIPKHKI